MNVHRTRPYSAPARIIVFCTMMLASVALTGCNGDDAGTNGRQAGQTAGNGAPAETLPEWKGKMSLDVMNWEELQQFLATQKGKVVVVQLWATWSDQGRRGLQELVKLQKRMGTDVTAVAVNTNAWLEAEAETDVTGLDEEAAKQKILQAAQAKVRPFLDKFDARFQNVISTEPDELLYEKVGVQMFAVIVYDQEGNLVERFEHALDPGKRDPFTYEKDIMPLVRKLAQRRPAEAT